MADLQRNEEAPLVAFPGRVGVVGGSLALIWAVTIFDWVAMGSLTNLAIHPRTLQGLLGIVFAPFLHVDLAHLVGNSIGFVILGLFCTARSRKDFIAVFIGSALTSGLMAWLLGATNSVHIGASGVVFGFLGFLMARGIFERSLSTIALSAVITWLFGSMVFGVFPILAGVGISWQAHLGGYLGGVFMAWSLAAALRSKSS